MRRPSRQGLIPVCKPGINISSAKLYSQEKIIGFTLPLVSYLHLLILIASSFMSGAQDLRQGTHEYFNQVRKGHYPPTPHAFPATAHEQEALDILLPFLKDSATTVREKAYELVYTVSSNSDNSFLRNDGVVILLGASSDPDAGLRATALQLLSRFHNIDFNLSARDSLRKMIRSKISPLHRLIKLGGFLGLTDLVPDIQRMSQPGNPSQLRWSALQSLARMGQPGAIKDMMERVKRLPINDDLVYKVFPDLIFTRQREPIAYVVEALQSDQKNCLSADVEREVAIPCGYRIMEQLAPVIEDFPLKLDESGDLITRDYPAALDIVRQWFRIHETYTILNDRY